MEHFRGSPLAALSAAALAGDRTALEAAVAELPQDVVAAAAAAVKESSKAQPRAIGMTISLEGAAGGAAVKLPKGSKGGAAAQGRGGSRGAAGEGVEVCGPASSAARAVVDSAAVAGAAWAAWRLGMLWTRRIAEATGVR